jgi:hypothetical protein
MLFAVKSIETLYDKAGRDCERATVLMLNSGEKNRDRMFFLVKLECGALQIFTAYSNRWAIECSYYDCN